jgi:hypothetical protein
MKTSTPTQADRTTRWRRNATLALLMPTLLTACAQIPASTVSESQFDALSCAELIHQTEEAKATIVAADQAKGDSWHAVLPFIVAARYGQASSAATEAERRLTLLSEQSARRGCAR